MRLGLIFLVVFVVVIVLARRGRKDT